MEQTGTGSVITREWAQHWHLEGGTARPASSQEGEGRWDLRLPTRSPRSHPAEALTRTKDVNGGILVGKEGIVGLTRPLAWVGRGTPLGGLGAVGMRWRSRHRGLGRDAAGGDTSAVAQGTRHTAVSQAVTQGVRFLTNIILARLLDPRDFGVVAIVVVVSLLLDQLRDVGTGAAIIQRPTVDDKLLNAVFYLNLALGTLLGAGLWAISDPLADLLGDGQSSPVMKAFAGIAIVGSLGQIHHSLLRRELRYYEIAVAAAVAAIVTALVSILFASLGTAYWALVIGNAAGALVGTVMVWVYDRWRPTLQFDLGSLRLIWNYSIHLFMSNVLFFFFTQIDKVIINQVVGGAGVGLYTMAQRTVQAPMMSLSNVVGEVTFPAFSRRQDDNAALRSGFIRSSSVVAFVTFPVMFGIAAVAPSLVPVVLGSKWVELVPLIWILAPVAAIQSVTSASSQLLLAKGRSDLSFRWGLLYSVVILAFELYAVRWGVNGVAAAFGAGIFLVTGPGLVLAFRPIGLSLTKFLRALWPQLWITAAMVCATLLTTFAVRNLDEPRWIELGLGILVGAAVYLSLAFKTRMSALHDIVRVIRDRPA